MASAKAPGARGRVDVAVIGGGIMGCATAYCLARRGVTVAVFERGRVAGEQSSRAWGLVRQQSRDPEEGPLAAESSRLWPTLARELGADVEFVRDGILVPAENEQDEVRLAESASSATELGIAARMVGREEMQRILPDASIPWPAGLFAPEDGHAEPRAATLAYAAAARREGVSIHESTVVLGVELADRKVAGIRTEAGLVPCDAAVCVAGIGAAALSRELGMALPIQVMRASVAQTARAARGKVPLTVVWSPSVSFRPRRDGSFYVSNGYRGIDGEHDLTLQSFRWLRHFLPTLLMNWSTVKLHIGRELFADLARRGSARGRFAPLPEPEVNRPLLALYERAFYEVYPQLAGLGYERVWAGRVDATPDLLPIIEAAEHPAGYFVAAGFNGHGFALAPAVGRALTELVLDGRSRQDLSAFRLSRFAHGKGKARRNKL